MKYRFSKELVKSFKEAIEIARDDEKYYETPDFKGKLFTIDDGGKVEERCVEGFIGSRLRKSDQSLVHYSMGTSFVDRSYADNCYFTMSKKTPIKRALKLLWDSIAANTLYV